MTRYVRNTVIQAKSETQYGAESGTAYVAGDAILIRDASFRIDPDVVPRQLIRSYFGASENLIGTRRSILTFSVELQGSGTAGTAPQYGTLLRACGMAQTITAGSRVEYTPVSSGFESISLRFSVDGVRYLSRGARGSAKIFMNAYEIPRIEFTFWGFDTSASVNAVPSTDFTGWRRPFVVHDQNSSDIRLTPTYATGEFTGGTILPSRGMEIDLGQKLSHIKMLGGEAIEITGRETTGSLKVFLTAADEVAWRSDINNNVLASLGFQIGNTAGSKIRVHMPSVQRINPQSEDFEGRVMMSADVRCLPSSTSGNDELRLIVS